MHFLKESQAMSEDMMKQIITAGQQIQQAPMNLKMVNQVNQALENGHIDIYG